MARGKDKVIEIISSVRKYAELEQLSGVRELCARKTPRKDAQIHKRNDPKGNDFQSLKREVHNCRRCDLARTRRNVVFGAGSEKAGLMFIGEAPGFDEDLQGLPFVGRAGQLLTKIIESIGLKREDVYIANVLKCRPPGNRNPLPTEILACQDYLKEQISRINPKIICALGKFAAQTLLKTETPITKLRGKFYDYDGTPLIPTFHPAYLLRNPNDKKLVWEDMKMIRAELQK